MLWLWDKTWPELIHPFASAIDTDLPVPEEMVCVKADSKPDWVRWPEGKKSVHENYGENSIEGWHKKHNLFVKWCATVHDIWIFCNKIYVDDSALGYAPVTHGMWCIPGYDICTEEGMDSMQYR